MLEKPELPDETIIACLQDDYGLLVTQLTFLPLGVDVNAAVYRAVSHDATPYFVKLRWGVFDETAVTLPKFLSDQGISQIIPAFATKTGQLWASKDTFKVVLYPFVAGGNGYEVPLTERHWRTLGEALRRIHATSLPPKITQSIQQESYSTQWRSSVKAFLAQTAVDTFDEPVAKRTAQLLQIHQATILDLVTHTEELAHILQAQAPASTVCHSDLHAGNLLIDQNDQLYIVDWDNPIQAPKERDLMFAGSGLCGGWHTPEVEETFFYQGYGPTTVNSAAVTYYRYERIIQDIAAFCEQLLLTDEGGDDREQAFRYLASNFLPDGIFAIAKRADQRQRTGIDTD